MGGFDKDFLWLFQKLECPAVCLAKDKTIVAITKAATAFLQVSDQDILQHSIVTLLQQNGVAINFSAKNQAVVFTPIASTTLTSLAKNILQFNWRLREKQNAKGELVGYVVIAEDNFDVKYLAQIYKAVTGQDKAMCNSVECYTQSVKDYYENIIAAMPGNVYWMDKNRVYLGCNDNVARFIGISSRKDIVGMTYETMEVVARFPKGQTDSWQRDDQEVIASGQPKLNIEEPPVVMPDGRTLYYLTNRVPLFDEQKNVIGVVGISFDITDRKLIEQELHNTRLRAEEAEKKLLIQINKEITGQLVNGEKTPAGFAKSIRGYYEGIIACMPGNIYWMDKNCVYLGCNDNAAALLGIPRKDVIGKNYEEMEKIANWPPGTTAPWKSADLEVITTGKPKLNIEEPPVVLSDDSIAYYLTNRVPIFDEEKNAIGVMGVSINISDRKKAEQLTNEKEVAEKTSDFMKMLAGSVAHEIRTPLAIIGLNLDMFVKNIGYTGVACVSNDETEELQKKYVKGIKHAIQLASCIIDNILIMLRTLASGKTITRDLKQLSMSASIESVLTIYPFLDHEKPLVKWCNSADFTYCGDEILTRHLLFNLIKNALRAIKEAEKGDITIEIVPGDDYNRVIFTDTAIGMPQEYAAKIFDQFETRGSGNAGTGLGLAFCKMVMQEYGGDIVCEAKPDEYARFILTFPRNCAKASGSKSLV